MEVHLLVSRVELLEVTRLNYFATLLANLDFLGQFLRIAQRRGICQIIVCAYWGEGARLW